MSVEFWTAVSNFDVQDCCADCPDPIGNDAVLTRDDDTGTVTGEIERDLH